MGFLKGVGKVVFGGVAFVLGLLLLMDSFVEAAGSPSDFDNQPLENPGLFAAGLGIFTVGCIILRQVVRTVIRDRRNGNA